MGRHLLLLGGGHAHMMVMKRLSEFVGAGHRVTLVNPDPYHYYSGMGPGLLAGTYRCEETRFHVGRMVVDRGGEFVQDRVVRIDAENHRVHLASGRELGYDVASCNLGSEVAFDHGVAPEVATPVKPIRNLLSIRRLVEEAPQACLTFAVVGGGPAGVEIAGNLGALLNYLGSSGEVTLFAASDLLKGFPPKVRRYVLENFARRGIRVREKTPVVGVASGRVLTSDGEAFACDKVVLATGVRPPRLFSDSGLETGSDGGLLVNPCLQSISSPDLFGGGDCISFAAQPLARVGVYAVRQNPVLYNNLMAALEGRPLKSFVPQRDCLLILNLGDGSGILRQKRWVVRHRFSFLLKDWIDRRFMQQYQVSGELSCKFVSN